MTMQQLKDDFQAGKVPKAEFISGMHDFHKALFQYADFIGNTDISRIEISDGRVVMTTRQREIKFLCDPHDHRIAPIEILNFDHYEKEECDMILRLVKDGDNVLDIGGNFGWYSLNIAKARPKATIFTFEPLPKTFDYLKYNVSINGAGSIKLFNFGFSDREQELTFYYYPEGSVNASAANLTDSEEVEQITCRVQRLDDFVQRNHVKVDFIKCDVEGAELLVYRGGVQTLKEQKPIVFTELLRKWSAKFGYHPNEVLELFRGAGYRCFTVKGEGLAEFGAMDDETRETNFFFLHAEKHRDTIASLVSA